MHTSIVELLRDHLLRALPDGYFLRQEQPLTLVDSEPEPDLAIVVGNRRAFVSTHPCTAALVIEIAVSSEALDRLKLELYAEAGVPECWLFLANERMVERHTDPHQGLYSKVERLSPGSTLPSTVLKELALPPPDLFGL